MPPLHSRRVCYLLGFVWRATLGDCPRDLGIYQVSPNTRYEMSRLIYAGRYQVGGTQYDSLLAPSYLDQNMKS